MIQLWDIIRLNSLRGVIEEIFTDLILSVILGWKSLINNVGDPCFRVM